MRNISEKYKVILMGSRPVAIKVLKLFYFYKDIDLVGVIGCKEKRKKWWKGCLGEEARKRNIKVISEDSIDKLKPNVIFSVNYTKIIAPDIVRKFRIINLHSLLPRYRGRNAVSWAIINARKDNYWKFGATLHEMNEGIDSGDIIETYYFNIDEEDTAFNLYKKWEKYAYKLIKDMLPLLLSGEYIKQPQSGKSYYYDKNSIKNKEIDLKWGQNEIYDRVRAYTFPPFERPYIVVSNKKIDLIFRSNKTKGGRI